MAPVAAGVMHGHLLMLLLAGAPADSIQGFVVDREKHAVDHAVVTLRFESRRGGDEPRDTVTHRGKFVFQRVPPGRYAIEVEQVGFHPVTRTKVLIPEHSGKLIEFQLTPISVAGGWPNPLRTIGAAAPTELAVRAGYLFGPLEAMNMIRVEGGVGWLLGGAGAIDIGPLYGTSVDDGGASRPSGTEQLRLQCAGGQLGVEFEVGHQFVLRLAGSAQRLWGDRFGGFWTFVPEASLRTEVAMGVSLGATATLYSFNAEDLGVSEEQPITTSPYTVFLQFRLGGTGLGSRGDY